MQLEDITLLQTLIAQHFSVTETALALHKSQSAVSKQLMRLESAVGVPLLVRSNGRITGLTSVGDSMLVDFNAIGLHLDNISYQAIGVNSGKTALRIATTHTQARYVLPNIINLLRQNNTECAFSLRQGSPKEVANWAANNTVDVAIATEALMHDARLHSHACYSWNRRLICLASHPLAVVARPSIYQLAEHDLVTYSEGFTGRSLIDAAFKNQGLCPKIVLTAADADVLKTYVKLDFGYGIIADMAYQRNSDVDLVSCSLAHLFEVSTTYAAFAKGKYLSPIMRQLLASLQGYAMPL